MDIINHFGLRAQMKKFNEETYEFVEAVSNYDNYVTHKSEEDVSDLGDMYRECVIKEMGDLLILATEFIAYFDISKEELDVKMDAQLEKIEKHIEEVLDKEK